MRRLVRSVAPPGFLLPRADTLPAPALSPSELPGLQEQKPGLKRQQYRDLLWKSWQKAQQNPMNARGSSAGLSSMGEPPSSDDE